MAPLSKDTRQAARLVLTAIKNLNMKGGVTLKHINSYIQEKYPHCQSNESNLRRVVDKAIAFGALKRMRNKYMLGSILDHIVQGRRRRKGGRKGGRRRRRRRRR